jgi:hypothetical protein
VAYFASAAAAEARLKYNCSRKRCSRTIVFAAGSHFVHDHDSVALNFQRRSGSNLRIEMSLFLAS